MINQRRGTMLLEVVAASLLVGVMMILSVQMLGWTIQSRRSVDQRAVALQEAANLLEEFTSLPWPDVTSQRLNAATLSAAATDALPQAKLAVSLREFDDDPSAKRITVTIDWQTSQRLSVGPVQLAGWIYRRTKE